MEYRAWAGILLFSGLAASAGAQEVCEHGHLHEKTAPYFSVHSDVRIHADQVYSADDSNEEIFNLKTHAHFDLEFSPVENWSVQSTVKIEQQHGHHGAGAPPDGKDTYFEDHMIFFEQLKLVYAPGAWEFFAGKFNPVDGVDQHAVPGFYGYEIIEEFSILGRLGAGAAYTVETAAFGNHRMEVSGFFRDTTVLNQSLITASGEPDRRSDGGVANTHDFSSWAASLSGDLFYAAVGDTLHEVDYVLSYARQDAGYGAPADHADEERAAIGLIHNAALSEDLLWRNVAQVKGFDNPHTHRGEKLLVSTFGSGFYYQGWDLGGSYSFMDSNADPDGHHAQISLGYTWKNGLGLHGGWKLIEEDDEQQKSLGLMVSWHGAF
jgi:hypothetical protein